MFYNYSIGQSGKLSELVLNCFQHLLKPLFWAKTVYIYGLRWPIFKKVTLLLGYYVVFVCI